MKKENNSFAWNGTIQKLTPHSETKKNTYPEYILKQLRQREELKENDTSMDEEFNKYDPQSVFREVCNWNGFIGWDSTIKNWIRDIYGIDIDAKFE